MLPITTVDALSAIQEQMHDLLGETRELLQGDGSSFENHDRYLLVPMRELLNRFGALIDKLEEKANEFPEYDL